MVFYISGSVASLVSCQDPLYKPLLLPATSKIPSYESSVTFRCFQEWVNSRPVNHHSQISGFCDTWEKNLSSRTVKQKWLSFLDLFHWLFRITVSLDPDGRFIPRSTSAQVSDNQGRKTISSCFGICESTYPSGTSPHWSSSLRDALFEPHGIVSLWYSHLLVIIFKFIRRCRLLLLLIMVISRHDCH